MSAKMMFVVLTNPREGREDAFNEWYTEHHLSDLLRLPGIVAARRYALTGAQPMPAPHPYKYCAIYEVETDDPQALVDAVAARAANDLMPSSDYLAPGSLALLFDAITDRVTE